MRWNRAAATAEAEWPGYVDSWQGEPAKKPMKLATLKAGGRDGTLVVVSRDLPSARRVPEIAHSLQQALDDWATTAPKLAAWLTAAGGRRGRRRLPVRPRGMCRTLAARLSMGRRLGLCESCRAGAQGARRRDARKLLDRSADVSGRLGRFPRAARRRSRLADEDWGIDLEGEVAVDHR